MATIHCKTVEFQDIQVVLFDKDGTLARSEQYLRHLGQKRARLIDAQIPGVQDPLLMAFGLEGDRINPAGLMAVGSRHDNEIAAAAYVAETGRDWIEALAIVRSSFAEADTVFQRKADNTPIMPDMIPLLNQLMAANLKVGIVSSDTTDQVQDFIQRYDLTEYITVALGCESLPSKPAPDLALKACQGLGIAPAQTIIIGDSRADIEMAKAACTAGSIGVTWGWSRSVALPGATAIATQVSDLRISP